jgi:hypothetical protein
VWSCYERGRYFERMDYVCMQNSTITIQHRVLPSTELLAEKLQNASEGLARLCCHLLVNYEGGDITLI